MIRPSLPTGRYCAALRLDDKSRMSGDAHVRICERLGVRFPGRLEASWWSSMIQCR